MQSLHEIVSDGAQPVRPWRIPLTGGVRLGPYEILGRIGRGGMGEVYRARDTRLGRDVAVKVLLSETEATPDQLSRFEREARAVAALNHPNILALHDIGNESGVVYVVMELLEGETLRERIEQSGRLPPAKAVEFAVQIARGLAAAHDRGIVHRDLKPENVFVTREGRVKILDFGLARQRHDAVAAVRRDSPTTTHFTTGPGVVVGTPGYISPEQMMGEAATSGSDLFAFGVVVYEMLTGSHPFVRATLTETATAVLRDDPRPLGLAVAGLPSGTATLVERCLAKHVTDRPHSARDLALYLESTAAADDHAPAARAVATAEWHRARTRIVAVAAGLFVAIAATTWGLARVVAERTMQASIVEDLARAEPAVQRAHRDRLAVLALTARMVASFPELKALFATDAATVRDYLVSYQQRSPGAQLLVALGPDGAVIGRTDNSASASGHDDWFATLAGPRAEPAIVEIDGRPFHAASAVADAGGNTFGYIVAAMPVDAAFAATLRDATHDEVVLLAGGGVLASTLRSTETPWRSRDEWRKAGGGAERVMSVSVGTQEFAAREIVLAERPPISAIVLQSHDESSELFLKTQQDLLIVGLLCAAIAALAGAWTARSATSARQR